MSGSRLAGAAAQRGYFERHLLVHTHIERTGGTSLVAAFVALFGAERIHDLRPEIVLQPQDMDSGEKARIWVLSGHFRYAGLEAHFARRKVYIAAVREPVARFLSRYGFIIANPHHPAYPAIRGKTPERVLAELVDAGHPAVANEMSRSLGISRPENIAGHLEESYAVVAPSDRLDELIAALYRIFGRPNGPAIRYPAIRYNVGPAARAEMDAPAQRLLRSRNETDAALYDYVNQRFDGWLDDLEERLCRVRRAEPTAPSRLPATRLGQLWNCIVGERTARTG